MCAGAPRKPRFVVLDMADRLSSPALPIHHLSCLLLMRIFLAVLEVPFFSGLNFIYIAKSPIKIWRLTNTCLRQMRGSDSDNVLHLRTLASCTTAFFNSPSLDRHFFESLVQYEIEAAIVIVRSNEPPQKRNSVRSYTSRLWAVGRLPLEYCRRFAETEDSTDYFN